MCLNQMHIFLFLCLNFVGLENEIFINFIKAAEQNGHFKVYNQNNLPERWHANNERRLGPILAVADIEYGFQDLMDDAIMYQKLYNVTSKSLLGMNIVL